MPRPEKEAFGPLLSMGIEDGGKGTGREGSQTITSGLMGLPWRGSMFLTSFGTLRRKQQLPSCPKPPWPLPVTTGLQSKKGEPQKRSQLRLPQDLTAELKTQQSIKGTPQATRAPGFSGVPTTPAGSGPWPM